MKLSELISQLESIRQQFGDLEILGGDISDDSTIRSVLVLDEQGRDVESSDQEVGPPHGVFLSANAG